MTGKIFLIRRIYGGSYRCNSPFSDTFFLVSWNWTIQHNSWTKFAQIFQKITPANKGGKRDKHLHCLAEGLRIFISLNEKEDSGVNKIGIRFWRYRKEKGAMHKLYTRMRDYLESVCSHLELTLRGKTLLSSANKCVPPENDRGYSLSLFPVVFYVCRSNMEKITTSEWTAECGLKPQFTTGDKIFISQREANGWVRLATA